MTETQTPAPGTVPPSAEKRFSLQSLYLKDASFEAPALPAALVTPLPREPEVRVNLRSQINAVDAERKEVVLTVTVEAKVAERTVFLVEVQQAGLFVVKGLNPNELATVLGAFGPEILFPYAREAVANLVMKGGFPPVLLQPINFDEVFRRSIQQQQQAAAQAAAGANG